MISAAILIASLALLVRTYCIERKQLQILSALQKLNNERATRSNYTDALVRDISVLRTYGQQSQQAEQNTIKALNQICEVLNKTHETQADYMNRSAFAIANIAACMIPFIDEIKECAIEDEEYEKAQECIIILQNLMSIVNPVDHE